MKRILLTGGSGFLGKNLALHLNKEKNFQIILTSRNIENLRKASADTGCEYHPMDINSINSIIDTFNKLKPDIIIHSAATKFVDLAEIYPEECIQTNIIGSINLLRAAKLFKIKGIIAISTDKAANPDFNIYSQSKNIMEKYFINSSKVSKINIACVRFGNLCWSTGSVFNLWEEMSIKKKMVFSTGPEMRRFFIHVDQACKLIKNVLKNLDKCNGLIITEYMKSTIVSEILDIWSDIYNVKWKKIKPRFGDKLDEYLFSPSEIKSTKMFMLNKQKLIKIDYSKKNYNYFKEVITSKNSQKLSKEEIRSLILSKPKIL